MEALLEEGKVERWNDDRLDELSRRMDDGFIAILTVGGGFAATTIASLLGVLLL